MQIALDCVFACVLLSAVVLAAQTVNSPFAYQLDGASATSTVKFTPFDMATNTKINNMMVTISWFRSDGQGCLPASTNASSFSEVLFTLELVNANNGDVVASDILSPVGSYSNTPTPVATNLIVQNFVTPRDPTGFPSQGESEINNQKYPTSGYFTPQSGFVQFRGQSIRNRFFNLRITDLTANSNSLCFTQFEVTLNCAGRAVVYKSDVTNIARITTTPALLLTPADTTQLTMQKNFPLQSSISAVTVTLAWTKSANSASGSGCLASTGLSGSGNRLVENIRVELIYQPLVGSSITVVLVQNNTWNALVNQTEANYFSSTFDSTSINFYPRSLVGGTFQPYQSLTVFNGLSPWGQWTLRVSNMGSGNGNPICVFGARVGVSTCTVNSSCLCGTQNLTPGAELNSQVGITTTNTF